MNEEVKNESFKPYMLWLLILTFVAPIGAAYWLYSIGGTQETVNNGEFVKGEVQLLNMGLTGIDGKAATEKQLYGHWHMMTFTASDCGKVCEERVYTMRQIKTSLHKESPRLTNVLIHFGKDISEQFKGKIKTHYANFERYYGEQEIFNHQLGYKGRDLVDKQIMFIVDPIGNVILKYDGTETAKEIISDIKRLLKASQIG